MKIRFHEWTFTKHLHTHSLNSHIMTCLLRMRRIFKKNKEPIISHRKLTLEIALITSFYFCVLSHFSCVWLCVILWTVAHQSPLSMGFSRQEHWSGLPCPPPGGLPDPGVQPASLLSAALAGGLFTTSATWEAVSPFIRETILNFPYLLC